jgi:hypothetical protein
VSSLGEQPTSDSKEVAIVAFAYVYRLGDTGIYKVGNTNDLQKRQSTHETISTVPVIEHARIETSNKSAVETYMKHRLQARRAIGLKGKDLYKVDQTELDPVVEAAREWNALVLPRMVEAALLSKQPCDPSLVLAADDDQVAMYRKILVLKQIELEAMHERERIETELQLRMGSASTLTGVAT